MVFFLIFCLLVAIAFFVWNNDGDVSAFFTTMFIVAWLGCGVGAHLCHVDDLATIETHAQIINIQSEKVDRLRTSLGELETKGVSLLNADTLMAKLIEEVALAEKDLANAKITLVKAKKAIIARSKSIFKFVI